MVSVMASQEVNETVKGLEARGCVVGLHPEGGSVAVHDGPHTVFWAIEGGKGDDWIVAHINSPGFQWPFVLEA